MNKKIEKMVQVFTVVLHEIPEIRYLGDPILRTSTQNVTVEEGTEIGKKLGEILVKYRKIAGIGRGLAAPQIGIGKSVFVTYLEDKIQTYINPKIVEYSAEKNYYRELCLSSGIVWADVERARAITMQWLDENGETHSQEVDGFMARLFQHEEAHLRGRPNLDDVVQGTIEFTTRDPLREQLRKTCS